MTFRRLVYAVSVVGAFCGTSGLAHASCVGMAMAYDGSHGAVWQRQSCDQARTEAINECHKYTRLNCTAHITYWNGWAVGVHCTQDGRQDSAIGVGYDLSIARVEAFRYARTMGYQDYQCRVIREIGSEVGPTW